MKPSTWRERDSPLAVRAVSRNAEDNFEKSNLTLFLELILLVTVWFRFRWNRWTTAAASSNTSKQRTSLSLSFSSHFLDETNEWNLDAEKCQCCRRSLLVLACLKLERCKREKDRKRERVWMTEWVRVYVHISFKPGEGFPKYPRRRRRPEQRGRRRRTRR